MTRKAKKPEPLPHGLAKKGLLDLATVDGNAMAIVVAVKRALRRAGNSDEAIERVSADMKSGDYDHLLTVATIVTEEG